MSGGPEAAQTARARLLLQVGRLFQDDSGARARAFSAMWDVPEDLAAVLSRCDDDTLRAAVMWKAGKLWTRHATAGKAPRMPAVPSSPRPHHQDTRAGTARTLLQLHFRTHPPPSSRHVYALPPANLSHAPVLPYIGRCASSPPCRLMLYRHRSSRNRCASWTRRIPCPKLAGARASLVVGHSMH
jgi:hypothetical protein